MSGGRWLRSIVLLLATVIPASLSGVAQENILSFRIEPSSIESKAGGRATIAVRIENASVREADNVVVTWTGPSGFSLDPAPQEIAVLRPFESVILTVSVLVPPDAASGPAAGSLGFGYTYCVGDLCFQISESRDVTLVVSASSPPTGVAGGGPAETRAPGHPAGANWVPYAATIAVAAGVCAAAFATWKRRLRWPLYAMLLLAAGGGLAYGVALGQHEQAREIAAVLCTSCVGIEEAAARAPQLSAEEAVRIRALSAPVDLLVFYAPWCRSCPYAEALVRQVAALNSRVAYRFVNVDQDPELARQYGVVQAGRTVVPAIARLGVGHALFGIENLESRLVLLLEEGG